MMIVMFDVHKLLNGYSAAMVVLNHILYDVVSVGCKVLVLSLCK